MKMLSSNGSNSGEKSGIAQDVVIKSIRMVQIEAKTGFLQGGCI
jgi:hypothetical protein